MIFKKIERIVELQQSACRDFGLLIELSSKLFNWVSKIREIRTWRTWIWFNCLQAFQVRHTTKIKNPLYFYQMINPTWKLCNISEITYNLHITLIFCEINYKFLFYLQFWPALWFLIESDNDWFHDGFILSIFCRSQFFDIWSILFDIRLVTVT